jgi:hypothetical protein
MSFTCVVVCIRSNSAEHKFYADGSLSEAKSKAYEVMDELGFDSAIITWFDRSIKYDWLHEDPMWCYYVTCLGEKLGGYVFKEWSYGRNLNFSEILARGISGVVGMEEI